MKAPEEQQSEVKPSAMMLHDAEEALQGSIHLKEMSVHVDIEMEQLRLARVDESFTRTELEKVQEERDALLQQTAQGRHIIQKLDNLATAKDLAKTVTRTRYDQIRDTLLSHAKAVLGKGGSPWGRGFHPNVQVQKGAELNILDMVKAVTWLKLVGMEEIVNIPLRNNTGFFRNAKPPAGSLELLTIPTIKIDKEIKAIVIAPKTITGSAESKSPEEDAVPVDTPSEVIIEADYSKLESDLAETLTASAGASVLLPVGTGVPLEGDPETISLPPLEGIVTEEKTVRKTLGGGTTRRVE